VRDRQLFAPFAYYELARIEEAQGRHDLARGHYEQFLRRYDLPGPSHRFLVDEAKVILQNGQPQLVDSLRGTTRGKQLTWFSNNDRLLVDGAASLPAESNIRRK